MEDTVTLNVIIIYVKIPIIQFNDCIYETAKWILKHTLVIRYLNKNV